MKVELEVFTEVVGQDRVPDGDVPGHPLVKAAVGKDPEGRREVLLPVQALFLERGELRIRPDLEVPPIFRLAHRLDLGRVFRPL